MVLDQLIRRPAPRPLRGSALQCPRRYSGRESGPGSGASSRSLARICPQCASVRAFRLTSAAGSRPGLTLRTEPAHQEAYVHLDQDATTAQAQLVSDSALAWAAEQQRQPSDLGLRITLLATAAPVTDASRRGGSDFALPLRDRAGTA